MISGCSREPDLSAAQVCLQSAQWQEAIDHLDEVIRSHPNSAKALYLRGSANFELRRYQEAAEDLKSARKLDPAGGDGLRLIEAHLALGEFRLAEAAALEASEPTPRYFVLRGRARMALAKPTDAMADFQRAINLDPKNDQAPYYLGVLLLDQADYVQAERHLTQAIALNPNHAKAFWLRAMAREKLHQAEAAEADRTTAKDLDPTFQFADSAMGKNLLRSVAEENRSLQVESIDIGSP